MNKRKLLSLLLVLAMVFTLLPAPAAFAEGEDDGTIIEDIADENTETPAPEQGEEPSDPAQGEDNAAKNGDVNTTAPAEEEQPTEPAAGENLVSSDAPAALTGDEEVEEYAARDTSEDAFYKILHLDCGRKYFTKDWIIALINEMAVAGYNQLQLAFGNDGLRFLLDDMSFTANETTYTHDAVVSAVEAGNKGQNSSDDARWLTEEEMDAIIAHANENGIEIVPLLNLPGHANAILDIVNDQYNAFGSNNTLDVANRDAAVAFGYAIFQKYVDYFAKKGCRFFNFGADEYANDASGTFSFSRLNSTQYTKFVEFINKMASYIESKGMTPRSFNDGLYYNGQSADIDTAIQCCYWSSGWGDYPVAAARIVADKGHQMINTNGDYYYVLGKDDKFDNSDYKAASEFSNSAFVGSTISEPAGSMFCIWCDYPNAETETQVAQKTRLVLRAMAARMDDKDIGTISTDVVPGGFNVDGTINVPAADTVTVADDATNVSVTAPGLTSVSVTGNDAVTSEPENGKITVSKTYIITLNNGDYTGKATVKVPYDEAFDGCTAFYGMVGTNEFDVKLENGSFICAVPHFSNVIIYGTKAATTGTAVNVGLGVGKTSETYMHEGDLSATGGNTNIATAKTEVTTTGGTTNFTIATALEDGKTYYVTDTKESVTTSSPKLTIEVVDGKYYLKKSDGTYFWPERKDVGQSIIKTATSRDNATNVDIEFDTTTGGATTTTTTAEVFIGKITVYSSLDVSNGDFSAHYSAKNSGEKKTLYFYTAETTSGTSTTTITFTGTGEGETSVTVGNTTYTITVTAPTETVSQSLVLNSTLALPDGATDVEISGNAVTANNGTLTANAEGTAIVTFVTKNPGNYTAKHYTYNITVTREDLSKVTPLTIEYWITNQKVTANGVISMQLKADDACSKNGVAMVDIVPATGTSSGGNAVGYWKSVRLDSGNKQTTDGGEDKTGVGTLLTRVRYYSGAWSYYTGEVWNNFEENDQLVAYYLQRQEVTDEVDTYLKDWGFPYKNTVDYNADGYVALTVAVVYPDGTVSPAEADWWKSSTVILNYWEKRNIGVVVPQNNSDYSVRQITVTDGEGTFKNGNYNTDPNLNWKKKTLEDGETKWYDETVVWDKSYNTDPIVDATDSTNNKLIWSKKDTAKLVLIYLEVEEKNTNLNVVWYDGTANTQIASMQVAMKYASGEDEPTYTTDLRNDNSLIGATKDWPGTTASADNYLPDTAYVTNAANVNQTFNKNLVTNTAVPSGVYKSGIYAYNGAKISEDGKTLTLYYVLDSGKLSKSYVIDFGLPVEIPLGDFVENADSVTSVTIGSPTYGTASYDSSNKTITYTPNKTLSNTETLVCTVSFGQSTQTFRVGITPASNVLYEENFFTTTDTENWELPANTISGSQEAQKTGESTGTYNVFGYDTAYASATGAQGVYKAGSLWDGDKVKSTGALTTTFYGNGFDLIGTSGKDTGAVLLKLTKLDADGSSAGGYLKYVDTRRVSSETTVLNQVPLAHVELDKEDATWEVTVIAAGLEATKNYSKGTYVVIDSFRVYRTSNNSNYPTSEQGVTYTNILDAVGEKITAWHENATDESEISTEEYENKGGPQNEIYLASGENKSVQIKVDGNASSIQVSLRAVNGETSWNTNNTIKSNTEMYYTVSVTDGYATITNTGNGMLAIGNVKLPSGVTVSAPDAADVVAMAYSLRVALTAAPTYDPIHNIDVKSVNVLRNRLVTLTVTADTDVTTLTVNGKTLRPTNALAVKRGWSSEYVYVYADTVRRGETKDYTVTATNANGCTATQTVQG